MSVGFDWAAKGVINTTAGMTKSEKTENILRIM
jgi:hypothetical protein